MNDLATILHTLIDHLAHLLPVNAAGELHDLADKVGTAATATAEAAGVIADATGDDTGNPAEQAARDAEIARLEKQLAELRATTGQPADGAPGA